MRPPQIDRSVKLIADIPELGLRCGEVGIVRSTWFAPAQAYEVEFQPPGLPYATRALLLASQVQSQVQSDEETQPNVIETLCCLPHAG